MRGLRRGAPKEARQAPKKARQAKPVEEADPKPPVDDEVVAPVTEKPARVPRGMQRAPTAIKVEPLEFRVGIFGVLGVTPLIYNAVSMLNQQRLLAPLSTQYAKMDRKGKPLHVPKEEFRNSVYSYSDADWEKLEAGPRLGKLYKTIATPSRLRFLGSGFKKSIMVGGGDLGLIKAQIGRWISVMGDVAIYGNPELYMTVVRRAGINRAPDIRTRATLREWAGLLFVEYAHPWWSEQTISYLLASGGGVTGIGDGRQQKGTLDFGKYRVVGPGSPELAQLMTDWGRDAQDAALANPVGFDSHSDFLMNWYDDEMQRRKDLGWEPSDEDVEQLDWGSAPSEVEGDE